MAVKITKKIALLLAVLVIGGGVFTASMILQPQNQTSANADSEKLSNPEPSNSDMTPVSFLNYDMVMGHKNAPIEIIEYAAISCSHCAYFHADVLPLLKEKYIDTGKVKLVYRNFIFDNPFDVFASSLTRCTTEENFFPAVKTYFEFQKVWVNNQELKRIYEAEGHEAAIKYAQGEVAKIGKMSGMSLADAQKCFDNGGVIDYLLKIRQEAVEKYQVNSTPTLIINGKKIEGHHLEDLERAIAEVNITGEN
ncbi:Periplasmic thiol:disulfide interchange protein DsbA [hydrothermal vent metagenome]|uniref:Periplasmic thiol:disulfide interchange protein DsbA n=1 Tax=hydrothermal vent metagenome TaxID=652676 RepID=A0A3B1AV16_9ZZZZ